MVIEVRMVVVVMVMVMPRLLIMTMIFDALIYMTIDRQKSNKVP